MKVKDLIEELKKYKDQEQEVRVFEDNNPFRATFKIKHVMQEKMYDSPTTGSNGALIVI